MPALIKIDSFLSVTNLPYNKSKLLMVCAGEAGAKSWASPVPLYPIVARDLIFL